MERVFIQLTDPRFRYHYDTETGKGWWTRNGEFHAPATWTISTVLSNRNMREISTVWKDLEVSEGL